MTNHPSSCLAAACAEPLQPLCLRLPATQQSLARVAEAVEARAVAEAWPEEIRFHVDLVLEELVQNIVSYGFPDGRPGEFELRIAQAAGTLSVVVEDDGDPFDPLQMGPPDLELSLEDRAIGGLGIHFTRTLMDACRYQRVDGHNRIELKKSLRPGTGGSGD